MDTLSKTIRRLSDDEYQELLKEVSTGRYSKPYIVLETVRTKNVTDGQMIEMLQVNPSTYYTLKSRLNTKIAAVLAKKVDNPISKLMDEVTRVPASLYGASREVSIRSLKELEKQLLEYDMSNELIIVYKTLAQLHLYTEDHEHYNRLYTKYVAFNLAGIKAENMFYEFIVTAGYYELTREEQYKDDLQRILREMSNIAELYDSHRLFVFFQTVRIYYLLMTSTEPGQLTTKEIEIDQTLQEIKKNFEKYPLDTLYTNLKFLPDLLYFIYYTKAGNLVRARHHHQGLQPFVQQFSRQYILNFHTIQYMKARTAFLVAVGEQEALGAEINAARENMDIDKSESYHYISFHFARAMAKFFEGDFSAAARTIMSLRNDLSLKAYSFTDIETKLFQALQYALLGEEDLFTQLAGSITRSLRNVDEEENIRIFIKIGKTTFKSTDTKKRLSRLKKLTTLFKEANTGEHAILPNIPLDEKLLTKLAR